MKKPNTDAYKKVCEAFKSRRSGATIADIVAKTALPLETVRELVPSAADEYSARLRVTESGEILYSFPGVWTSKYTGFKARFSRAFDKISKALKTAAAALFKVWIMIMLIGYFVLFMLIALAALLLSAAASNNNNNSSSRHNSVGGLSFASGIFDMIIRIWFYSELTKSIDRSLGYGYAKKQKPKGKPLYKAIFSFVFGDGDPNADMLTREKKAVIAYIQANSGVISLPEFMTLTGADPLTAESRISSYCVEFGGSPEATDDGTVVYRFDDLLLRADKKDRSFSAFSPPIKRLQVFSSNKTKSNVIFSVINSVNLFFGSYFFINVLNSGHIITQEHFNNSSYVYGVTYVILNNFINNPLPVLFYILGVVPIAFSILFWLIPAVRYALQKKDNEQIKKENLRKSGYGFIWDNPLGVKIKSIIANAQECRPKKLEYAQEKIIKEMGTYSVPQVEIEETGEAVYSFTELKHEQDALNKYRQSVDKTGIGKIVFDTD